MPNRTSVDLPARIAELPRDHHSSLMSFAAHDVSPEVEERQARRYREMTPAEKLACADVLCDLAWNAVTTGVRLRHPDADDRTVTKLARELFRRAAD